MHCMHMASCIVWKYTGDYRASPDSQVAWLLHIYMTLRMVKLTVLLHEYHICICARMRVCLHAPTHDSTRNIRYVQHNIIDIRACTPSNRTVENSFSTVLLLGVDIMHQYPCHEMSSVHDIYAKCAQVLAQRASLLESLARRLNGRADSGFGSL